MLHTKNENVCHENVCCRIFENPPVVMIAMALGSFKGAVQLSLRLLTEYVCLGFSLNLNSKSQIVPTMFYCHIGILISSARMRLSLSQRRITKINSALHDLFTTVRVGQRVLAKKVVKITLGCYGLQALSVIVVWLS